MNLSSESKSRRQLIIEAAAIHFNTNGYAATSMKDIAQSVGIQAASLYNHISSKQEILSELLLTIANKFGNGIKSIHKSDLTYKEKLKEVIRQHIKIATENQNITSLITQDWKHLENPHRTEFVKIREEYQTILLEIITKGMEKGELVSANITITLNVIISSLRWVYNSKLYKTNGSISIEELENTIIKLVFKGIELNE